MHYILEDFQQENGKGEINEVQPRWSTLTHTSLTFIMPNQMPKVSLKALYCAAEIEIVLDQLSRVIEIKKRTVIFKAHCWR